MLLVVAAFGCGSSEGSGGGGLDAGDGDAGDGSNGDSGLDESDDAGPDSGGDKDGGADTGVPDAGSDGAIEPVSFDCAGSATTLDAASLPATLSSDVLDLTISELAANAAFTVCKVPAGSIPAAVLADAPLSDVYYVETAAVSFKASVEVELSDSFLAALSQGTDGTAAIVPRIYEGIGAPALAAGATLHLTNKRAGGELTTSGFVYLSYLGGAFASYAVEHTLPGEDFITGEVIELGAKVKVLGTPSVTRALELTSTGCNVEPIGPEGTKLAAACGTRESVERATTAIDGSAGTLGAGVTIDLTDDDASYPPPRFFCPFAAEGEVEVALTFKHGSDTELTVFAARDVTCTVGSRDLIHAANFMTATRLQHGPLVPSLAPYGAPLPAEGAIFTSAAHRAELVALGADGVYYQGPTATLSETPLGSVELAGTNSAGVSVGGSTNTGTLAAADGYVSASYDAASIASKEPTQIADPIDVHYFPSAGGKLTVTGPGSETASVSVSSFGALDVSIGDPAGVATEISFADGTANAIYVRGIVKDGNQVSQPDGFVRFINPSDLPLASGRRTFTLLSPDQTNVLSDAGLLPTLTHVEVGFLNVAWDEARVFWPGGRVMPIAGGTLLEISRGRLETARDDGPCDLVDTEPDATTGCRAGKREVLLVSAGSKVEMFDPVDGGYLGRLIDAGTTGPDGFVHVVQNDIDHCLYASQQTTSEGDGIWRYDHEGSPLSETAFYEALDLTPAGLFASELGPLLAIANQQGGVLLLDTVTAAPYEGFPGPLVPSLSLSSVLAFGSELYLAQPGSSAGDGEIGILSEDLGSVDLFIGGLGQPHQLALDAASVPNLLVALAGDHAVAAYAFESKTSIRTVNDLYTTESPMGVWPLLNDQWLVAGAGLGVDVMTPGTHVRNVAGTSIATDAGQISRACLPTP